MGPLLYMWSVNDRNVVMQCVVVVISAQNKTVRFHNRPGLPIEQALLF